MRRPVKPDESAANVTGNSAGTAAMMDTREVAAYLRLKERRIYDLVRKKALPHVRATGKLLFPRKQIEAWLAAKGGAGPSAATAVAAPPQIVAGSHDPLLEWALRESGCGLATLACGSRAGLEHLAHGRALVAALHWRDEASGDYNVPLVRARLPSAELVVVEWARRVQGLVLTAGNPAKVASLRDVVRKRLRVILRQPEAGSAQLLAHLLAAAKLPAQRLNAIARPALTETDLAAAIAAGRADAGIAIEAAARGHALAFVPLAVERMDLVLARRDYFEPPVQALLRFARSGEFGREAAALRGYDVSETGRIVHNA